jgi:hypothetical protein
LGAPVEVLKNLSVGDLLIGRVARVLDDGRVLVTVRGTDVVATTTFPVAKGEQVRGIVQTKGPPLVLKVLSEGPSQRTSAVHHLRSLLSRFLPHIKDHPAVSFLDTVGPLEKDQTAPVARWLHTFALGENNPPDAQRVNAALIHGGMFFEQKLRQWAEGGMRGDIEELKIDLKGVVLKLLDPMKSFGGARGEGSEKSVQGLESLLGKIELLQMVNWLAEKEGLGFFGQIPLRFGEHLYTADVLFGAPSQQEKRTDGYRVLLLLDMGGLGYFQIDVLLSPHGVTGSIGVDRQETVRLVRAMMTELKQGLKDQGLAVLGIECSLLEKPMDPKTLILQFLELDETESVNIRV